ncbi:hypothetical protein [Catellatospora citrea]|uniref:Uncharacterized protein n=1 Tax=Catellatospora citrea TaxID=53366 RepID=A0A8J3KBJ6_9ACTN|nr:hypothetical protein [Catellatospora citrea]RKE12737.1 hypothetical protein C8E86_7681 [Catellatospora citrea]GIF96023.1 hypothetical protein Cci01nite_11170 [Catellatospora citrea]
MNSTAHQKAAWDAYIDVAYGLQRAICEGERFDGEVDWEWAVVRGSLHDHRLSVRNARLLALLDQAQAHWRDCPVDNDVLAKYLDEIADGLRDLAEDQALDGW